MKEDWPVTGGDDRDSGQFGEPAAPAPDQLAELRGGGCLRKPVTKARLLDRLRQAQMAARIDRSD